MINFARTIQLILCVIALILFSGFSLPSAMATDESTQASQDEVIDESMDEPMTMKGFLSKLLGVDTDTDTQNEDQPSSSEDTQATEE